MGKFEQDAREMLEAIGGKENVAAVTQCNSNAFRPKR